MSKTLVPDPVATRNNRPFIAGSSSRRADGQIRRHRVLHIDIIALEQTIAANHGGLAMQDGAKRAGTSRDQLKSPPP